jgi:hypothetical protein
MAVFLCNREKFGEEHPVAKRRASFDNGKISRTILRLILLYNLPYRD